MVNGEDVTEKVAEVVKNWDEDQKARYYLYRAPEGEIPVDLNKDSYWLPAKDFKIVEVGKVRRVR